MPVAPLLATAIAFGSDDILHTLPHDSTMELAQQAHATAFIQLPIVKQKLLDLLLGPELAPYHWAHGKALAIYEHLFGTGATNDDHGRMVEYIASGCPHCKHMEPIWNNASQLWAEPANEDSHRIVWEQKQCLDENWKPGADYAECKSAQITHFPAVKFFAPGSRVGEEYDLERTSDALVDFAKSGLHPNTEVMPRTPGDMSDFKLIDFYAEGCKHCKALEPIWEEAHKQWDKAMGQTIDHPRDDAPLISFEKRECYDAHWNPGKDASDCQKYHVNSFPSIKLFGPDPHGHGFMFVDYTGSRTPQGIVDFLERETGVQIELAKVADVAHPDHNHVVQGEVASAEGDPHILSMPSVAQVAETGATSHSAQINGDEVIVEVRVGPPDDKLEELISSPQDDLDGNRLAVNVSVDNTEDKIASEATEQLASDKVGSLDDKVVYDATDKTEDSLHYVRKFGGSDKLANDKIGSLEEKIVYDASDKPDDVGADLPLPMREAVKIATMSLPMLSMSYLPVSRSYTTRTQKKALEVPAAMSEFL